MALFPVTVRYRFGEGGESRDASFHGLLFDRSDNAVLGRLEEAHSFAPWIEVIEVRWRGGEATRKEHRALRGRGRFVCPHADRGGAEPGPGGSEEAERDDWQPRRHARCRMFKPAHLVTDGAVFDCVLLDLSPDGAKVCVPPGAALPDRVVLVLPTGESRRVVRRWHRGSLIGFEAVGEDVRPS